MIVFSGSDKDFDINSHGPLSKSTWDNASRFGPARAHDAAGFVLEHVFPEEGS